MKRDFFIALELLARAADDAELAGMAVDTLEYCVAELRTLQAEAGRQWWHDAETIRSGIVRVIE